MKKLPTGHSYTSLSMYMGLLSSLLIASCDSTSVLDPLPLAGESKRGPFESVSINPPVITVSSVNSTLLENSKDPDYDDTVVVEKSTLRNGRTDYLLKINPAHVPTKKSSDISLYGRKPFNLNDRGSGPDEYAQDGIFTATLPDKNMADAIIMELQNIEKTKFPVFKNRALVSNKPGKVLLNRSDFPTDTGNQVLASYGGGLNGDPSQIDPGRELMIVDPSVIDDPTRTFDSCTGNGDPDGAWSFKTLFSNIANPSYTGIAAGDFAREWALLADVGIAGNHVIDSWIDQVPPGDPLNMDNIPLTLAAIVNRIDLRNDDNAGELRFVFLGHRQVICDNVGPGGAGNTDYTVILEYKMPGATFSEKKALGKKWHKLKEHDLGSDEYLEALEAITTTITSPGANPDQGSNRSYIGQVRINTQNGASSWGMRDFILGNDAYLTLDFAQLTPTGLGNNTDALSNYINNNEGDILDQAHQMTPDMLSTTVNFSFGATFWNGSSNIPINNLEARHLLSLNTCSGCHARETDGGAHIIGPNRIYGETTPLAGFLTGIDVADPVTEEIRHFNDILRRRADLAGLISNGVISISASMFAQPPPIH